MIALSFFLTRCFFNMYTFTNIYSYLLTASSILILIIIMKQIKVNILETKLFKWLYLISMLLIFSIILTYTNISESFITPVIIVVKAISIFIGSSIGNLKMRKNGLLNGALIGGIYLLSIYFISGIINHNFSLTVQSIIIVVAGMVCGMFGGIIGVNKANDV